MSTKWNLYETFASPNSSVRSKKHEWIMLSLQLKTINRVKCKNIIWTLFNNSSCLVAHYSRSNWLPVGLGWGHEKAEWSVKGKYWFMIDCVVLFMLDAHVRVWSWDYNAFVNYSDLIYGVFVKVFEENTAIYCWPICVHKLAGWRRKTNWLEKIVIDVDAWMERPSIFTILHSSSTPSLDNLVLIRRK